MTNFNKATLATFFESGDTPQGSDFTNLIDSQVNLVETAEQAMAGPLSTTKIITPKISAANINVTVGISAATLHVAGNVSGNSIWTLGNLNVSGSISASSLSITNLVSAGSLNVSGDVSAATGTVYASAIRMQSGGIYRAVSIVSAAGTTQATGAVLGTNGVFRLKGIADGTTTGFLLLANQTGLQQTLWVEENTSCNLWPCIGGQINALSSNAAFPLAGNTQYIVTHIKASGYSVK